MRKPSGKSTLKSDSVKAFASLGVRKVISLAIVIHLATMALSFTSIVEPSNFHTRVLGLFEPYQQTLHLDADKRAFYLAHGGTNEQPHRIQSTDSLNPSEDDWKPLVPETTAGLAASDRMAHFLSIVAQWSEEERSSEVATLLRPLVLKEPNAKLVRVIRLPTGLTTVVDDAAPPPYVARIVRSAASVELVQIKPARFVTTPPVTELPVTGPADIVPADIVPASKESPSK